jgi:hypothetical protein
VPDEHARDQFGQLRRVPGDGPGEDLDLDTAVRQPLGHLHHVDVQAPGVSGAWLFQR